jgi:hypothetical protein
MLGGEVEVEADFGLGVCRLFQQADGVYVPALSAGAVDAGFIDAHVIKPAGHAPVQEVAAGGHVACERQGDLGFADAGWAADEQAGGVGDEVAEDGRGLGDFAFQPPGAGDIGWLGGPVVGFVVMSIVCVVLSAEFVQADDGTGDGGVLMRGLRCW